LDFHQEMLYWSLLILGIVTGSDTIGRLLGDYRALHTLDQAMLQSKSGHEAVGVMIMQLKYWTALRNELLLAKMPGSLAPAFVNYGEAERYDLQCWPLEVCWDSTSEYLGSLAILRALTFLSQHGLYHQDAPEAASAYFDVMLMAWDDNFPDQDELECQEDGGTALLCEYVVGRRLVWPLVQLRYLLFLQQLALGGMSHPQFSALATQSTFGLPQDHSLLGIYRKLATASLVPNRRASEDSISTTALMWLATICQRWILGKSLKLPEELLPCQILMAMGLSVTLPSDTKSAAVQVSNRVYRWLSLIPDSKYAPMPMFLPLGLVEDAEELLQILDLTCPAI
jgi:hypothetical protein